MTLVRRCAQVVFLLLLAGGPTWANSVDTHGSSGVAKERRRYIQISVDELNGRAKSLRKVIAHRRAACDILGNMPSESANADCGGMNSLAAADQAISSALVSLKSARLEMKSNNFDLSEKYVSAALRSLSEARRLVSKSDD